MIIFKTTKHLKSRYRPCENCPIYIKSRNMVKEIGKKSGKLSTKSGKIGTFK